MLLSTITPILFLISSTLAVPAPISINQPQTAFPLTKDDIKELGRMARVINAAHCPTHRNLQPSSASSSRKTRRSKIADALRSSKRSERSRNGLKSGLGKGSNILSSSHEDSEGMIGSFAGMLNGEEQAKEAKKVQDLEWFIAHTSSSKSLTLSMSSLASTDSYLSLLTSTLPSLKSQSTQHPISNPLNSLHSPLPSILFPEYMMARYFPEDAPRPAIHRALMDPLLKHGPNLVLQILELLESPPSTMVVSESDENQVVEKKQRIEELDIVAHGLGSAVSLIIALSVQMHLNDPSRVVFASHNKHAIESQPSESSSSSSSLSKILEDVAAVTTSWTSSSATKRAQTTERSKKLAKKCNHAKKGLKIKANLFGMSRVGDEVFARWVDNMVDGGAQPIHASVNSTTPEITASNTTIPATLQISRINSFADPIPHLPATWQGFSHFRSGEMWVDGDPRTVWDCKVSNVNVNGGEQSTVEGAYENPECANSITMDRTSLLDHAGPFGGVWIGPEACM